MTHKNELLLIHLTQFGYHNNAYNYCKYLKDDYNITFICQDAGKKKISLNNVKVIYIPTFPNRRNVLYSILRNLLWNMIVSLHIFISKGIVFVFYYKHSSYLKKIFKHKKMVLDIRTLGVTKDEAQNNKFNSELLKTANLYDVITILSHGMVENLNLVHKSINVLPLGANVISTVHKDYSRLRFLYVGTLTGRDIHKTLEGLYLFRQNHSDLDIQYDIVGDGVCYKELKQQCTKLNLDDIVTFHGRIPNTELKRFFDSNSYGISFVPKTSYYDNQPVTKTFEYALSGLYVIATSTSENKKVITEDNGMLIKDDSHSFKNALEYVYKNNKNINEKAIRDSLLDYSWENIVVNKLKPILNILLDNNNSNL